MSFSLVVLVQSEVRGAELQLHWSLPDHVILNFHLCGNGSIDLHHVLRLKRLLGNDNNFNYYLWIIFFAVLNHIWFRWFILIILIFCANFFNSICIYFFSEKDFQETIWGDVISLVHVWLVWVTSQRASPVPVLQSVVLDAAPPSVNRTEPVPGCYTAKTALLEIS